MREFVDAVRSGKPLVKQMLMGGGKTTVVGPMLALMLGDGETLVIQTMPQVEMHMPHAKSDFASLPLSPPTHLTYTLSHSTPRRI